MRFVSILAASLILVLALGPNMAHSVSPIHIYLDADLSTSKSSSTSIERGIRTALSESGNTLSGHPVKIIALDHRGNTARSLGNLETYLFDPQALALFSGLHSPPLLVNRRFINDNGILVLDPWAAAGPITRPMAGDNWIFRLSVDDSKAGEVIVQRAVGERGFKHPALLLENTGWGKSNQRTMTKSLMERGIQPSAVTWFDWGLSSTAAKIQLRDIRKTGADVIFLVANAPEGQAICQAMNELPESQRLPIVSHWGITGGSFPQVITSPMRRQLDLEFIQTRFSFLDMGDAPFPNQVFREAAKLFPDIRKPADIVAPTGFVHAYDLTRLLMKACEQVDMDGDMKNVRAHVREALEHLASPVQGLIKVYDRPFRPYTADDVDAHEALGIEDFTFGRYGEDNEIILVR